MSPTLTVFSARPFTNGRALPDAAKWLPTSAGFAYEAQSWRITVRTSVPVDPALIPADARSDTDDDLFSTDVVLDGGDSPPAARELFEATARNIAVNTRGRALGDKGLLAPVRSSIRTSPRQKFGSPRSPGIEWELMKGEALLRFDRDLGRMSRRNITIVVAIIGLVVVALTMPSRLRNYARSARESAFGVPEDLRIPFDPAHWKSAGQYANSGRLKMADDLVDRHLLIGLTEEAVVDLLGMPCDPKATGTDRLSTSFEPTDRMFRLGWLGPSQSNAGPYLLVVHFDAGGRVTAAEVVR